MKKLPLLYFFAHSYFRHQVLDLWDKTEQAFTQSAEAIKGALREKFETFKLDPQDILLNKDVELSEEDFDTKFFDIDKKRKITVIKFPTPKGPTEVTYVGVLNGDQPRYFTFELMLSENPKYVLCEWLKEGHKEYDKFEESNLDIFVENVKHLILQD